MSKKIVIIGAGSAFGGRLSVDVLSVESLRDATIALCDINAERLGQVAAYVQKVIDSNQLPAQLQTSTDRREVLADADCVVLSVSIGGPAYYDEPYESEISIPERYGLTQPVGDTVGPGGVFRALRTGPVLQEIAADIAELAPAALVLNYTNPMAMLTWVLNETMPNTVVGLCHGVQGTSKMLAKSCEVPYEELDFLATGINHMTWFVKLQHQGQDLYPRLHEHFAANPDKEIIRAELFKHTGYFCTESSRHLPEYLPYFQHDTERLQPFCEITRGIKGRRAGWYEDMGVAVDKADSVELVRSHEWVSTILEAMQTGKAARFYGNVVNHGLIPNLPDGCIVELPVLVDHSGILPAHVGPLPAHCAALCQSNVSVQELTAKAILNRDAEMAFHALMLDPITMARLPLDKIRQLFEEMWEAEGELLSAHYQHQSPLVAVS